MTKEECLKKLRELNNIGKPVKATVKGTDKRKEMGRIEDLVSHIVDENRYEIQKIKLHKGGIAYRTCYYTGDSKYIGLKFGGFATIMNESDFSELINKAKKKGWIKINNHLDS